MSCKLDSKCSAAVPERVNHDQPGNEDHDGDGGDEDGEDDEDDQGNDQEDDSGNNGIGNALLFSHRWQWCQPVEH